MDKKYSHKNQKKAVLIVFAVILIVLAMIIGAVWMLFKKYMNLIDFDHKTDATAESQTENVLTDDEIMEEILAEEEDTEVSDSPKEEIEELESEMQEQIEEQEKKLELLNSENVFNVMLVGCDSREKGGAGRSDAMILVSVNKETEEIYMTSIMRDCYVTIPGKDHNRINAAYAFGGGKLLLETMETNFAIDVDKYVAFDFYSFMDVVDSVGGIEIDVSEAELEVLNGFVIDLNAINGRALDKDLLEDSGYQHLNGIQALCYSRIRHAGNGDFDRTKRQQEVIEALIGKVQGLSLTKMNDLLTSLLPGIKTNFTEKEILALLVDAVNWLGYDMGSLRIPMEGSYESMRVNKMSVLGIDLKMNYDMLAENIYHIETED